MISKKIEGISMKNNNTYSGVLANGGTEDSFKLSHFRLDLGSRLTSQFKMTISVTSELMTRVINVLDNLFVSLGTSGSLDSLRVNITITKMSIPNIIYNTNSCKYLHPVVTVHKESSCNTFFL
jgi:hypothetical protein